MKRTATLLAGILAIVVAQSAYAQSAAVAPPPASVSQTTTAPMTAPVAPIHHASPCPAASIEMLDATLWAQTAAEHDALALQTYASARNMLAAALADSSWTAANEQTGNFAALPPAIILDADETIFDNSMFEARMLLAGRTFDPKAWDAFVAEAKGGAIPGSVEFLKYAKSKGVTIFYVTNRPADQEAATRTNLISLGFPMDTAIDTVLMLGEQPSWNTSDKTPRRAFVAATYRVLMLFGDDLNDFAPANGKTLAERQQILAANADKLGNRWFVLPNAMYGSWERAVSGKESGDCAQLQHKMEELKP